MVGLRDPRWTQKNGKKRVKWVSPKRQRAHICGPGSKPAEIRKKSELLGASMRSTAFLKTQDTTYTNQDGRRRCLPLEVGGYEERAHTGMKAMATLWAHFEQRFSKNPAVSSQLCSGHEDE